MKGINNHCVDTLLAMRAMDLTGKLCVLIDNHFLLLSVAICYLGMQ